MTKNLFVTLADKNYLDQIKQLFSSIYFNAGWNGDCMLLSHEIADSDLEWFQSRGILVKKCVYTGNNLNQKYLTRHSEDFFMQHKACQKNIKNVFTRKKYLQEKVKLIQ